MKYATFKHRARHQARAKKMESRRQHMTRLRQMFGPNWREIMARGRGASTHAQVLKTRRARSWFKAPTGWLNVLMSAGPARMREQEIILPPEAK